MIVWAILILLLWVRLSSALGPKQLEPLYDCTTVQRDKLFKIDRIAGCGATIQKLLRNRTSMHVRVKKFFITKTNVDIFLCDIQRVTMTCKKEFFGSNSKSHSKTPLNVRADQCWRVVREKLSPGGHLFKVTDKFYSTHTNDRYKCHYKCNVTLPCQKTAVSTTGNTQ